MSRLNKAPRTTNTVAAAAARNGLQVGVSANGNVQFVKAPAQALYEILTTSMFGRDGQLKTNSQLLGEMRKNLQAVVDAGMYDFVANLAIHARTEMNMRTMPIVMVVEFAKMVATKVANKKPAAINKKRLATLIDLYGDEAYNVPEVAAAMIEGTATGYTNMRKLVCDVIQRADQITDLYAYALTVFGSKNAIPMAVRRGVADACNKFNEYHFGKYDRTGAVSFRDILRIVHPAPKSETQGQLFAKIMAGTVATPYTWETELSINGQRAAGEQLSKKALWTQLLKSGNVGYMALLRNMRNIHDAGVDMEVQMEYLNNIISNPAHVAKSKQLPFDLLEAYRVVKPINGRMATAVSKALDLSCKNIPQLGKRVWFVCDFSGSMGNVETLTSAISTSTLLLAAMLKACEGSLQVAVTLFGSDARTLNGLDTNKSVLDLQADLQTYRTGKIAGSTNFQAGLAELKNIGFTPDTVIVLTDNEVNGFPYHTLKTLPRDAFKLTINMSASTTTPFIKGDGWYNLSGWSPAMFKWVPAARNKETVVESLSGPYMGVPNKSTPEVEEAAE